MTKVILDLHVLLLSELINNLLICSLSDSLTHSFYSFIHSVTESSLTHSLAGLLPHSFIHLQKMITLFINLTINGNTLYLLK